MTKAVAHATVTLITTALATVLALPACAYSDGWSGDPTGYPSRNCPGGKQYLDQGVGPAHGSVSSGQSSDGEGYLCVRLEGLASAGGRLTVDPSRRDTPQAKIVESSADTAPCTTGVVAIDNPLSASIRRSPTGGAVPSVCIRAGSTEQRITAAPELQTPPTVVEWTWDPGTAGVERLPDPQTEGGRVAGEAATVATEALEGPPDPQTEVEEQGPWTKAEVQQLEGVIVDGADPWLDWWDFLYHRLFGPCGLICRPPDPKPPPSP
jgi:hypothetical protein